MKKRKYGFEHYGTGIGKMVCPGCGSKIMISEPGYINVCSNTNRFYAIKDFWIPDEKCNNPLCKWGDIFD